MSAKHLGLTTTGRHKKFAHVFMLFLVFVMSGNFSISKKIKNDT